MSFLQRAQPVAKNPFPKKIKPAPGVSGVEPQIRTHNGNYIVCTPSELLGRNWYCHYT